MENIYFKNLSLLKAFAAVCIAGLVYLFMPASIPEAARRMSFIFILAALFWAFEIIPLYATALMVIILETFLLCRPGGVLGMNAEGYKEFLLPFGSSVIILFLGGFVLAEAMSKYQLDIFFAEKLIRLFGKKPYFLMLGFMLTTAFISMWMSNTAATAMMIAMIIPVLNQIDSKDLYRKGLILSIPFAANIGGIGTPVGTPPNAIAIGILADHGIAVDFFSWMKMAVPLEFLILFIMSVVLYLMFPSRQKEINIEIKNQMEFNFQSKLTLCIVALTIFMWLTSEFHKIPSAMIALLAAGILAVAGLMKREDFNRIDWDVLILMWGGLALGKGLEMTGLTKIIVEQPIFAQKGIFLVIVFCVLTVIITTFMSNTATANLIIPVAMAIPGENPILLAITIALCCSFSMMLPISSPPNAIAYSTQMIETKDMIRAGFIVCLVSLIILLLGYQIIIPKSLGGF